MSITYDGILTYPREVEGSPRISVDEITHSQQIVRRYAQLTSAFKPLAPGSRDPNNTNAILISETMDSIQGPVCYFTRTFNEIPAVRTEPRMVSFTLPGKSRVYYSTLEARYINFDKYGAGTPATSLQLATVAYSYAATSFTAPQLTQILYAGAPVDFVGEVWVPAGSSQFLNGLPHSESLWVFEGHTTPAVAPTTFVISVNITRWRGPIFQMEVVSVTPTATVFNVPL